MAFKKNQEFNKRLFSSQPFLFFLSLVLIWVGLICIRATYKKHLMITDAENIKAQSEKLKNDLQKLSEEKALLGNPSFLEKEAKLRLNLKKEGEEVVILSRENNLADVKLNQLSEDGQILANASTTSDKKIVEEKNWQKWRRYFFRN
jgi:cell division protein FtsL